MNNTDQSQKLGVRILHSFLTIWSSEELLKWCAHISCAPHLRNITFLDWDNKQTLKSSKSRSLFTDKVSKVVHDKQQRKAQLDFVKIFVRSRLGYVHKNSKTLHGSLSVMVRVNLFCFRSVCYRRVWERWEKFVAERWWFLRWAAGKKAPIVVLIAGSLLP